MAVQALDGIKVVDLTHAYNGPFCTMILADNGADVIKVEPPEGDQCRTWGPMDEKSGESGFYTLVNRNKKGITLNLKNDKAREMLYDLIRDADVVVENYRPGVAKKLKVDYDSIKEINPSIIYASGSGFGQYGPLTHRPCYDIVAQSMAGLVNLTGFPDSPPTKVGPSVADNVTGIYLSVGILMALIHRGKTGEGQHVDVSMVDTIFSLLENFVPEALHNNESPQRRGNIDPSIAPFDIYETKDGWVAVGVGNDNLFDKFCKTIGKEELLEDPRYASNVLRVENYVGDLQDIIAGWCIERTKGEIEALLDEAGIPCGPVLELLEVIDHPHIKARDMMVEVEHPTIGKERIVGNVIKMSKTQGLIETAAPILGQHNKEVFGLSEEDYEKLKEEDIF